MANKGRIKIVVVGGGSYMWTPQIVKDFMLIPSLAEAEIVLYDINLRAAKFCKTFLEKVGEELHVRPYITAINNRPAAFRKADYFVVTISCGGLAAMAHDLAIPEKYGIYHTVGDTTGPGGWARAIRNFGALVDLGQAINKYAPGAVVLNYCNPMPTLTDILTRTCRGPVIGLCSGIFENVRFIKEFYKLKSANQITMKYAGLNHLFWITEAKAGSIDIIADLRRRLKKKSLNDIIGTRNKRLKVFESGREVADELFRITNVMPYLGDRHTCEFFSWFITNKENMKRYNIIRTSVKQRQKFAANRLKELQIMLKRGKIEKWCIEHSHETAAETIEAHSQGRTFIDTGNLVNTGQISNLPNGCIVETAVKTDRNGFTAVKFGPLPEPIVGFCLPYARVHKMIVDSCFARDKNMAIQALRLDPVCSHLNTKQVNELGERMLAAHKQFITVF